MWTVTITTFGAVVGRMCGADGTEFADIAVDGAIARVYNDNINVPLLNACALRSKVSKDRDKNGNRNVALEILPISTGISMTDVFIIRNKSIEAMSKITDVHLINLLNKEFKLKLVDELEPKKLILP